MMTFYGSEEIADCMTAITSATGSRTGYLFPNITRVIKNCLDDFEARANKQLHPLFTLISDESCGIVCRCDSSVYWINQ